jgi:hypothetical protein
MSKHTPGPWTINPKAVFENNGFKINAFPVSGSGQAIAAVWAGSFGKGAFGLDNQEANARLIAAAPDLLAVARMFAQYLADNGGDEEYRNADGTGWLTIARAAIAKAEGTS